MVETTTGIWFSQLNTTKVVGIIIKKNEDGKDTAYIDIGFGIDGLKDTENILKYGNRISLISAKNLFHNVEND